MQAKALKDQRAYDQRTRRHPSLGYICLLVRIEGELDLGAVVLPPLARKFVGPIHVRLKMYSTIRGFAIPSKQCRPHPPTLLKSKEATTLLNGDLSAGQQRVDSLRQRMDRHNTKSSAPSAK